MLIVEANKEYFDRAGWKCAIEDILEFYFPDLVSVDMKFNFVWKAFGRNYNNFGVQTPKSANSNTSHYVEVMYNGNDRGDYDILETLLHELRHVWQHHNGDSRGTLHLKGNAYWNHPKEIDARDFAKNNIKEAYDLVKEYLQ